MKFSLGQIVATPGAIQALAEAKQNAAEFLDRHGQCDWGIVCTDDKLANEDALQSGARLLSAYKTRAGTKLWVITEAVAESGRRESTCILLPEDY